MIHYENLFSPGKYSGIFNIDFKIPKGGKVMDIGGGSNPFRFATHVLDLSAEEFEVQRHGRKISPKITSGEVELLDGKAEDILPTLGDNEFDFIHTSHVIEHFDNLPTVLDQISRVGKRGYITTPKGEYDVIDTCKSDGHKWLFDFDYANRTLLYRKRMRYEFYYKQSTRLLEFGFQGHKKEDFFLRPIWEIRLMWEDSIEHKYAPYICGNTKYLLKRIVGGNKDEAIN